MPSSKQLAKKRKKLAAQQKSEKEKKDANRGRPGVPASGGRSCAMKNRKGRNRKDKSGGRST